jgi:hypothetical protein
MRGCKEAKILFSIILGELLGNHAMIHLRASCHLCDLSSRLFDKARARFCTGGKSLYWDSE